MKDQWNPGVSKGRDYIDKLRTENTISKWDAKHNRFVRDGSTWAEQEIDKLDQSAWESANMTREKTLRRLEQYMKQGMNKSDALKRLRESLQSKGGPANPGKLAILTKDD